MFDLLLIYCKVSFFLYHRNDTAKAHCIWVQRNAYAVGVWHMVPNSIIFGNQLHNAEGLYVHTVWQQAFPAGGTLAQVRWKVCTM